MVQIIKSNWWWGSWWGGGEWDMKKSVYDPNNVGKNVYDYTYFINKPTIPTKTSDLDNDSDFVDSSDLSTALSSKQNTLTAGSGIEITNDVISATWGWGEWNTKTFYLSSVGTGDLTTAQAVVDWYLAGKNPIIVYTNKAFVVDNYFWSSLSFKCFTFSFSNSNPSYNEQSYTITTIRTMDITINESTWTATRVNYSSSQTMGKGYLAPWVNYSTPYLPEYDGSPATKKYVDDSVSWAISAWTTAPSNPAEWQIRYDTTNDVVKVYDWTNWNEVWVESNTKTFYLSSTSDLTNAQAVYDWYLAGKNPIIVYSGAVYNMISADSNTIKFESIESEYPTQETSWNAYGVSRITLSLSSWTVTAISPITAVLATYLAPNKNYSTPYTPQYDGSPATKKYVDDSVSWSIKYEDFETSTTVWATLTISYFTTQITPTANFTLVAGTVKEWMQYIVRVNSWATAYTMSLGTWVTNPFGEDLTLTASKTTTVVLLATSSSTLEIFSIRTAE